MAPRNPRKWPRTVAISMCLTEKPIVLWLGSICHTIPATAAAFSGGRVTVSIWLQSFFVRPLDRPTLPASGGCALGRLTNQLRLRHRGDRRQDHVGDGL